MLRNTADLYLYDCPDIDNVQSSNHYNTEFNRKKFFSYRLDRNFLDGIKITN